MILKEFVVSYLLFQPGLRNVLRAIDQDIVDENEPLAIIQSVWLQESIVTLKFILEKNQRQRDAMNLFSQIQTNLNQLTSLKVGRVSI